MLITDVLTYCFLCSVGNRILEESRIFESGNHLKHQDTSTSDLQHQSSVMQSTNIQSEVHPSRCKQHTINSITSVHPADSSIPNSESHFCSLQPVDTSVSNSESRFTAECIHNSRDPTLCTECFRDNCYEKDLGAKKTCDKLNIVLKSQFTDAEVLDTQYSDNHRLTVADNVVNTKQAKDSPLFCSDLGKKILGTLSEPELPYCNSLDILNLGDSCTGDDLSTESESETPAGFSRGETNHDENGKGISAALDRTETSPERGTNAGCGSDNIPNPSLGVRDGLATEIESETGAGFSRGEADHIFCKKEGENVNSSSGRTESSLERAAVGNGSVSASAGGPENLPVCGVTKNSPGKSGICSILSASLSEVVIPAEETVAHIGSTRIHIAEELSVVNGVVQPVDSAVKIGDLF